MTFDNQLDQWLDQIDSTPMMNNLTEDQRRQVELIVTITAQVLVEGYGMQPEDWTAAQLNDLFINRFVQLLNADEKKATLFALIPTALSLLLNVVRPARYEELRQWVIQHHDQLVNLYDRKADDFYRQLLTAMKIAQIDQTDKLAVARFTKQYLRRHPNDGRQLFIRH
ncbi:hypothetical protein [Secundilactobacillus folii]|uniref:Uncharacterized protein n=1 Tax=Secundilactobacillus folii TaxID=2678357 RepID=A0A7X2XTH1_9LACO|nr:hypothetical protein [Secundilactobacillus folii]MTV81368.1 hypothetical protein [Secundilactobacillus folii]